MTNRISGFFKCDHEWWVISMALCDGFLILQCPKCRETGTIRDPSREEWSEAFHAPSNPYPWRDESRVCP